MHIPAFFYSDVSLSHGFSTPEKWSASIEGAGYGKACIIDMHSMSSMVKFVNSSKKQGVSPILGASIEVSVPDLDNLLWTMKNKVRTSGFFKHYNITMPSDSATHSKLLELRTLIHDTNKTKREGRFEELANALVELGFIEAGEACPFDQQNIAFAHHELNSWDFNVSIGSVVVVAKNAAGYKNILRMISQRALNQKEHGDPTVTLVELSEYKKDVVLVDPLFESGVSFRLLDALDWDLKKEHLELLESFDEHLDYYGLPVAHNDSLYKFLESRKESVSSIPMPISRFIKPADYKNYCVKVAVQSGVKLNDPALIKPSKDLYLREHEDIVSYYNSVPDAAGLERCFWDSVAETSVSLGDVKLPNYHIDVKAVLEYASKVFYDEDVTFENTDEAEGKLKQWIEEAGENYDASRQRWLNDFCLHQLAHKGLKSRLEDKYLNISVDSHEAYYERLEYEFKVIRSMGFSGYFLIQFDFVDFARRKGVPVGDGRGSAAGSLIVYALEITDVDPISYDLQFERFLNPERVSMPDIDVDFGDDGTYNRETVLAYIRDKYQDPKSKFPSSSQIANINRYQLKTSISSVRDAYGLSQDFQRRLGRLILDAEKFFGISAPKTISWSEFLEFEPTQKMMRREKMIRNVLTAAKALTGQMSTYGLHAGGVVISPTVLPDYAAIDCDSRGNFFSQLDKDDIESAGLIKFDVLGLKTLTVIAEAVEQIKQNKGVEIDVRKIPKDCSATFALLCNQVLGGIFQLEGGGMSKLVGELQPRSVDDIGVLSALFRPGPLESQMHTNYLNVKYGREMAKYDHPSLEAVTKETHGQIIYQEQVMSIVRELAGYSLGQADLLRRAMGKKKIEEMQEQRAVYSLRAQKHWRNHFLSIGEKQGFEFPLDVCLEDIRGNLRLLGIEQNLNEDGYICEYDSVLAIMKKLLGLKEDDIKSLEQRVSDINYTVALFKEHYLAPLDKSIKKTTDGKLDELEKEELSKRVYFSLSQYVRFNQVFNKIEKFAGYGFNKSHAIAYSIISYVTGYLKTHYGAEFYAATLSYKDTSAIEVLVAEAKRAMDIKLSLPDVNKSKEKFSAEGDKTIRYGLSSLKGMGQASGWIVKERVNGVYLDPIDMFVRIKQAHKKMSTTQIHAICVTGGMDSFIPKRIARDKEINGRSYIEWTLECAGKNPWTKDALRSSPLHRYQDEMSYLEFAAYLYALTGTNWIKKNKMVGFLGGFLEGTGAPISVTSQVKVTGLRAIDVYKVADPVGVTKQLLGKLDADGSQALEKFEIAYLSAFRILSQIKTDHELNELIFWEEWWRPVLSKILNTPIAETLAKEREIAGLYMTSNPIQALRISRLAEQEPPSSVMDGAPVEIREVDMHYAEQPLTTYGLIRDLKERRVRDEQSLYFGEPILVFDLEHGLHRLSCSVFGSHAVKAVSGMLEESAIILAAGTVQFNDYGLSLRLEAFKRYYPDKDETIFAIPRKKRGK